MTILAAVALPYVLVYFHRVAPAVVVGPLMAEFHLEARSLGLLAALYFAVYTVLQVPAGILSDSLGPRRTISAGSALAGLGSLLFGLAPSIELAFAGRFLVGVGVSFIFVPILRLHVNWFEPRRFATLSGLTLLLGNLGALLASSPLASLAERAGWRSAFLLTGALGILAAAVGYAVVRDAPIQVGLPWPDGHRPTSATMTVGAATRGMLRVMSRPINWIPFFAFAGIYGALMSFQGTWGSAFLQDVYALTPVDASSYMLFLAIGLMIGSPFVGWLADHLGRKLPVYFVGTAIFALCVFLVGRVGLAFGLAQIPLLWVRPILFIMGFAASAFILTWPIARSWNSPELAGSATGFANMGGFSGGALLPPLFGWILDASRTATNAVATGGSPAGRPVYEATTYGHGFLLLFCGLLVSLVLIAAASIPRHPGPVEKGSAK